jgi:hypothetical protein
MFRRIVMSEKLNVEMIKRIIEEEKLKLVEEGKVDPEVIEDAWSGGKNLVNKIDYIKELGIKEERCRKKADAYKLLRAKLKKSIIKEL